VTTLDVVVVSYNSRGTLRECVESLSTASDLRVIVVDNASQDRGVETVEDLPISIIRLESNGGFAHGCNRGWRAGSAPYVLFLNPDARLQPGASKRLAEVLEKQPEIGIAAPKIVDSNGEIDYSLRRFPRLRSTYAQAVFLHRVLPRATWTAEVIRDHDAYTRPFAADWVSGACMLVRRELLQALGGFDEGFFMYCEDKDLCRRAHDAGFSVLFVPDVVAMHVGGASAPRAAMLPTLVASRIRYEQKHSNRITSALARVGIGLGVVTHMIAGRGGASARAGHARALHALVRPKRVRPRGDPFPSSPIGRQL